jgi:DUF4097 and DUF4098 domain-containing protein YvlB
LAECYCEKLYLKEMSRMLKKALVTILILAAAAIVPQVASLKSGNETPVVALGAVLGADTDGVETQEVREEFRQSYPLSANGRIMLDNLNGGVKIKVWDRNEVEVVAEKRAFHRERLAEATIEVNATPDLIRIRTRYPGGNQSFRDDDKGRYQNPAVVEYTLTVPKKAKLEAVEVINGSLDIDGVEGYIKASSVNGRVTAKGLASDARLSTVNGNLEASFNSVEGTAQIALGSVNGNLTVVIPSNANAQVRAGTLHGAIGNDFGLEVHHGDYIGHELYGQIGTGGPRIKLGNVNGSIWIRHNKSGPVSPATSLLSQKDKDKDKDKDKIREEARKSAQEARQEALEELAQERAERLQELQEKKEIDRALREAEREIQRAQLQVEREQRREMRERMRAEGRGAGKGEGAGGGAGGGVGGGIARFTAKETKTFTVSGTPRVHIETHDGVVSIRGWDKPEVMYTATKRAGSELELNELTIKAEQVGSNVTITVNPNEADGSASLEVYVPRNASLEAASGDGQLSLDGVSGDVVLRTGDGPINVSNSTGVLTVSTGDGPIKISRFNGQIEARTGDGPISLDGRFTAVHAQTGSGSVTLAVPADLSFTIETNAEDVTNEGLVIMEELPTSKRFKRWKVGQGGKVFVINTGEGRLFLRSR